MELIEKETKRRKHHAELMDKADSPCSKLEKLKDEELFSNLKL